MHFYRLAEADCLGFSLIKLSRDGQFAQLKLTSNSLNMKDLTGGPGHSFSRSTHAADGLLPRDARNLPIDNTHVPGGTNLSAGTHCMGQGWANALVAYLNTQGLAHIAKSMD